MDLQEARALATSLMNQHLDPTWSFKWNNRRKSYGICSYSTRTIQLSRMHTENEPYDRVKDTIIHEIAHAIAGPDAGHGPKWKQAARSLGLTNPTRTTKSSAPENIPYKWVIMYEDQVVQGYYRKPGKRVATGLPFMSIKGKPESRGKLRLERVE